ncbi:MAG: CpsB/CapC family capsule biosynthesis tyrosine phosphatase [Rikenellaceae bacterium]
MIFFGRKHNILETPFFEGFKDYHNHTLPGVDDGVQTLEDSLAVLSYFEQLKIKEVVLTPHVMIDNRENVPNFGPAFAQLCKAYHGPVKLSLASEYMLDYNFLDYFKAGARMLAKEHILVETSYMSAHTNFDDLIHEITSSSIIPVVAHPERYLYMDKKGYYELKDKGCKLQLNLFSFTHIYGKTVPKNALHMLGSGMYDIVGTDLHGLRRFKSCVKNVNLSSKHIDMLLRLKENKL